jgi:hypothetical protein
MKRKVLMMGLAMVAGVPHAVHAKSWGVEGLAQSYSSWNAPYMPRYGTEASAHPLMDHLSAPAMLTPRSAPNEWRLKLAPPVAVSETDDPLTTGHKRVGFSFKLDF